MLTLQFFNKLKQKTTNSYELGEMVKSWFRFVESNNEKTLDELENEFILDINFPI